MVFVYSHSSGSFLDTQCSSQRTIPVSNLNYSCIESSHSPIRKKEEEFVSKIDLAHARMILIGEQ